MKLGGIFYFAAFAILAGVTADVGREGLAFALGAIAIVILIANLAKALLDYLK